jgi:hypothetical protein
MTDTELEARAADFWAGTDLADAYPRGIEQAIALKLPVTVVKLPVVTVQAAGRWLRRHHRTPAFPPHRHDLMGCLYADSGHSFIFVCGADGPEEQRFTLAHDAAHFLVDYWWPRRRVIQALGPSITDVLDGRRRACVVERASAILASVRAGPHWHLLPRQDGDGNVHIACAEDRADELGLELVAPRALVVRMVRASPVKERVDAEAVCRALGTFFGLPAYVFETLVSALHRAPAPSFLEDARRLLGREA